MIRPERGGFDVCAPLYPRVRRCRARALVAGFGRFRRSGAEFQANGAVGLRAPNSLWATGRMRRVT